MLDDECKRKLKPAQSAKWESLVRVIKTFLGNHGAENYAEVVEICWKHISSWVLEYHWRCTFYILMSTVFPPNLHNVSEKYGERFHWDIEVTENQYQGKFLQSIMGDYCWFVQREMCTFWPALIWAKLTEIHFHASLALFSGLVSD